MAGQKHILVYVARHGTTGLNKADAFRGPIDAPLDSTGLRDAHQLAKYLEPVDLSYIIHSGKDRTRTTAKIVAQNKDMNTLENSGLRAWDVGDLGGKPKTPENVAIVEEHVRNPNQPLPGGESLNDFKFRVCPLILEAIDTVREGNGIPILLVAHSSVVHEVGMMIAGDHDHTLVEPGGVCAIYICDGKLNAEPIFKPREQTQIHGEAIT